MSIFGDPSADVVVSQQAWIAITAEAEKLAAMAKECAAERQALRARVAELEADAERLNWLQANPRLSTIRLAGESDRECYMYAVAGAPGLKLREIIDAARLSGNKPPQCFSTEGDDRR